MKKIYLALMCMASLTMMTACGGDKKADKAADTEGENTEMTNDEQAADEQETASEEADGSEVWGDPTKAVVLDMDIVYSMGDFKPAGTIIFEDTLGGETAGELPSKWDIKSGSAEVGEANGHYYITMLGGDTELLPKVGENKNFLPESYSMEFQFLFGQDSWYHVNFFNAEDEGVGDIFITFDHSEWNFAKADDDWIHGDKSELSKIMSQDGWNHFAVSYDKGNVKLFVNSIRIANLPSIKQAAYFIIRGDGADGQSHYIRGIRVAK